MVKVLSMKILLEEPIPKCTIYQSIYNNNKNYPQDIAINYFGNKDQL